MAYYKNEFDTGFVIDEKTGESTAMFTVGITVAEYRELVAKAAKNEAARLADDFWKLRTENIQLRAEIADLKQKIAEVREAAE
uniref:Uncharacterized protein n=1 Tax=Myoviridae sp. ctuIn11 TaxID=2827715 RepID=A0A8S5SHF8_9CAUD|nr:MAG TPA: hypothetical protein [Myoviridae sp. ctuIn11]